MTSSMAEILKNVIRSGGMPLSQVNERIETMYLSGRINAEERNQLTELMHEKARPENEMGGWKEMYEALAAKYNELDARVRMLEEADGVAGGSAETEIYPAWQPWDGVSNRYQLGDVVAHAGRIWESMCAGLNVWEPGTPGVDERYWKEVVA